MYMSDKKLAEAYNADPQNPEHLQEIVNRWLRYVNSSLLVLKPDDDIFYADFENGGIEHGHVVLPAYVEGELDSFSVEWDNNDFDEYDGRSLGTYYYTTEQAAREALLMGEAACRKRGGYKDEK